MTKSDILDLYDLALLLNYERASTEPRFRHAKLREAVFDEDDFQTITLLDPEWTDSRSQKTRAGFVFDTVKPRGTKDMLDVRDLPSNMLPERAAGPSSAAKLTRKQLETIYWQARGHDGCFKSIALLQHFFDMYPPEAPLRVRTAKGEEYVTTVSTRVILEMDLIQPKRLTLACVFPAKQTYITGADPTMVHAVAGFADHPDGNVKTVLDLASMQFGDEGRGLGGRSTFVLEDLDKFYDRIERIALNADTEGAKASARVQNTPPQDDLWLKAAARRVKERWENRDIEGWCGHCGAPAKFLKCSVCGAAWYCDKEHQNAAWPFHKKFCKPKSK